MAPGLCGEWKCNHSLSEGYYPGLTGFSWPFGRRLGNDNGQLCRVREMGALPLPRVEKPEWQSNKGRRWLSPSFWSYIGASASTSWVEHNKHSRGECVKPGLEKVWWSAFVKEQRRLNQHNLWDEQGCSARIMADGTTIQSSQDSWNGPVFKVKYKSYYFQKHVLFAKLNNCIFNKHLFLCWQYILLLV